MIVALYARVSTEGQNDDNQLRRLEEYANRQGWPIFDCYADVASGANPRRPALDRMLADAKARLFDMILCTKLDRMARSTINLLEIMTNLEIWNVSVMFLDQPIDTRTAAGRMMLAVLASMAEFERELIRDRTKDGLARAKAEGRHGGRPARKLTDYQLKKARRILAENPQISTAQLCAQFDGISRQTLTNLLRKEGII